MALTIDSSAWRDALRGRTGITELCLFRQCEYGNTAEHAFIRITPIRQAHLELRYVDSVLVKRQWYRIVAAENLWPALIACLERRDWQTVHDSPDHDALAESDN